MVRRSPLDPIDLCNSSATLFRQPKWGANCGLGFNIDIKYLADKLIYPVEFNMN